MTADGQNSAEFCPTRHSGGANPRRVCVIVVYIFDVYFE